MIRYKFAEAEAEGTMDIEGRLKLVENDNSSGLQQGVVLSETDFTTPTQTDLATLARQASHSS